MNETKGADLGDTKGDDEPEAKLPAGVTRSRDLADSAFARILLIGTAKVGKTTAVAATAPKPLIINCDGEGATQYAATSPNSGEFLEIRAENIAQWNKAQNVARQLVKDGDVQTIVIDTFSILSERLWAELDNTHSGFELFKELQKELIGGYNRLATLPAHLVVTCHMDPREDEVQGIMPLVMGRAKAIVPALVADWVLINYDEKREPDLRRAFVLGQQDSWSHSGRHIKKAQIIPARFDELLSTLGFAT